MGLNTNITRRRPLDLCTSDCMDLDRLPHLMYRYFDQDYYFLKFMVMTIYTELIQDGRSTHDGDPNTY